MTKHQKYVIETWERGALKGAPYNPRRIDEYAKKKLRENLKRVGLLAPIVVNRRTGNIVSGHQRVACLDALEGKAQYRLSVAVVDLDEKTEREQCIFMNNESAMGTWDEEALRTLLAGNADSELSGFDKMDLDLLFGQIGSSLESASHAESEVAEAVQSANEAVAELKAAKRAGREKAALTNDSDFYIVVVFASREEQVRFLAACKLDTTARYVDGRRLAHVLGVSTAQ